MASRLMPATTSRQGKRPTGATICGHDRPHSAQGLCGACYQRQRRARVGPLHTAWVNMVQRCTNPNHERYADYGGRGITIDPRWMDYATFEAEMPPRPPDPADWTSRKAYWSIDRVDNHGNYEPGNVRWATPSEQAYNRRAKFSTAA